MPTTKFFDAGGRRCFFTSPPGPLSKKRGGGEVPGICGYFALDSLLQRYHPNSRLGGICNGAQIFRRCQVRRLADADRSELLKTCQRRKT